MRYPYLCPNCQNEFDVIKSVREIENEEKCEKCQTIAQRTIASFDFYGAGDWDKAQYNPAFGCVVKSKAHQREILRKFAGEGKHFEEVGNEPVDKIHSHFEKERSEKRKRSWAEVDRIKYNEQGTY